MSRALELALTVSKARRVHIDAQLRLEPQVTVLFGPSGIGKTTLLLAIAGLFRPDAGRILLSDSVLFDSEKRIDLPPEARRIALVFQSLSLFPHLSALDNVAYGLARTVSRAERRERARAWLSRMHVGHVADRKPATFSGGEAQRVALARALAFEPRALLLDEPFSAMDDALRLELGKELASVLAEVSIPVLLVTHDERDAARLGDRVLLMRDGKVSDASAR